MVTQVSLGNFYSVNGKNVLNSAGGSGLDEQALITSLVAAKSTQATQDQDQITLNDKQSAALSSFQTLLSTFQSASDALRNPPGVGNDASNAFKLTTASIGNGGNAYFSVTSAAGAAQQSYNISDISSLASAASQGTGIFTVATADASVVPPASGTVAFGAGQITIGSQSITISSGDSLNVIAAKFNGVSATTGISATVIQGGANSFQLSFAATATGTNANFDLSTATDMSGVLTNVGLTTPVSGTNSSFDLNGINIVRQSNVVSDAVTGLSFTLLQKTPDSVTNYSASIQPDTTTVQNSIVNYVNAYNAIKSFAATQTQLNSDGTYASTAVLANNATFRATMSSLNQQIVSQVNGVSSTANSLASVGITLTNQPATSTTPEVDNILNVDDGVLSNALASNFAGVNSLFGFTLTADTGNVKVFADTKPIGVSAFTLNIDPTNNVFTATYDQGSGPVTVNLTATALSGSYSLVGPAGSALDGLTLIYGSTSAATVNVTTTQGIADQTYNTATAAVTPNTGTLAVALTGLKTSNTSLNADITAVNDRVAQYKQQLLNQFAALEQAVSQVNSLLQSLAANDNAKLEASQS